MSDTDKLAERCGKTADLVSAVAGLVIARTATLREHEDIANLSALLNSLLADIYETDERENAHDILDKILEMQTLKKNKMIGGAAFLMVASVLLDTLSLPDNWINRGNVNNKEFERLSAEMVDTLIKEIQKGTSDE